MFVLIVIILLLVLLRSVMKYTHAYCESKKRLDNKTCIITGGTSGMGLEIAREMAKRGAKVIIACPFPQEGQDARAAIVRDTNNQNVIFKHLDLSSLQSTRDFAQDILQSEERLDILINNAGIGIINKTTKDGLLYTMQVNYYGHFLLTNTLLPLLKKSGTADVKSRIVNVASHLYFLGRYKPGSMNTTDRRAGILSYSDSKLCLMLHALELAKRLEGSNVLVNAVDPGAVGTRIFELNFGKLGGLFIKCFYTFCFNTPWQGAQCALYAALDESVSDISGKFFRNCKVIDVWQFASDPLAASKLWEESIKLVNN